MNQRVLIAGGGVIGCLTAMALVARGWQVTLVERGEIGQQQHGEASWAAAGILLSLPPWMYSDAVNTLTLSGARLYPALSEQLLSETGIDPEYQQSGMLLLPKFDKAIASDWFKRHQIEYQTHQSAELAATFAVQSLTEGEAFWLPTIGQIRPTRLLQALRAWLKAHHVVLREHTTLLPIQAGKKIQAWHTVEGEKLEADQYLLASGAWAGELLGDQVMRPAIKPMRGQMLLYAQPSRPLEHLVYREGFYIVPRKDGYILAGSTVEDVGFDATTTDQVAQDLRAKAEAILPALNGIPPIKHWSGLRPGSPENLPTISVHPEINNLYLNIGHFRYGLTMAPSSAEMLAAILSGELPVLNPAPYSLAQIL